MDGDKAKESGRVAGQRYDAEFRRFYMTEFISAGFFSTPAKEPKNPFSRSEQTHEWEQWRSGYIGAAYAWLAE